MNPLQVTSLASIFSHSVCCLFILFMVFFAVQKFKSLIGCHLSIFVFIIIPLGGGSEKMLLQFMSECVQPMFPSNSFVISGLTFRTLSPVLSLFLCVVLVF